MVFISVPTPNNDSEEEITGIVAFDFLSPNVDTTGGSDDVDDDDDDDDDDNDNNNNDEEKEGAGIFAPLPPLALDPLRRDLLRAEAEMILSTFFLNQPQGEVTI